MNKQMTMNMETVITCADCGAIIDTERDNYVKVGNEYFCADCCDSCSDCCEVVPKRYLTETACGPVCNDCITEYEECHACGYLVPRVDLTDTQDGPVCDECLTDYSQCAECGEWVGNDDLYWVIDDAEREVQVCYDCRCEYYNYCEGCDRYVHENLYNFDYDACIFCAPQHDYIAGYHEGNPNGVQFKGTTDWSFLNGYLGFELEVTTPYDDADRIAGRIYDQCGGWDLFHFEEDCSVAGFEIISQPMSIEYLHSNRQTFQRLFDILNEEHCSGEDNGLHVHVSRTAFGDTVDEQSENVAKVFKLFSGENYRRMVTLARRTTDKAASWAAANDGTATLDERKRSAVRGDRYKAINTSNYETIEFRLGAGTTDIEVFYTWLETIAHIVKRSRDIADEQADNFDQWFVDLPENVLTYFNEQGIHVYAPMDASADLYRRALMAAAYKLASLQSMLTNKQAQPESVLVEICNLTERERRALNL